MTDLMKELMAEAQKVNGLEVEVNRTIEARRAEVRQSRTEKLIKINAFLMDCADVLIEADAMRGKNNQPFQIWGLGTVIESDGYSRDVGLAFSSDQIDIGGVWIGSGTLGQCLPIDYMIRKGSFTRYATALIDSWTETTEEIVQKKVAEHVKETLNKRIENMRKNLEKSNNEYEKYRR